MASKLTCVTQGGGAITGTRRKSGGELGESFTTRVSEATMPQRWGGGGDQGVSSRKVQRVEGARTIAPDDQLPAHEILHRTTSRVKFNRTVVGSKLANRYKILNKLW